MTRLPRLVLLLAVLLPAAVAPARVLRVPEDHAGIQAAFDVSQEGDTVLVARGTWTGLLESPVHSILFCSQFLFSQDSTDIVETVLDGQYAGTILNVNTLTPGMLTVTGFTFYRGQGQQTDIYAYCDRAAAVNMQADVSATLTDLVFSECRAPRNSSVLFMGNPCSGNQVHGDLVIRNIQCRGCVVDPDYEGENLSDAFLIKNENGKLIVDGFQFNGGGLGLFVLRADSRNLDTLSLANVDVFNCDGSSVMVWWGRTRTRDAGSIINAKFDGCIFGSCAFQVGEDTTYSRIENIEYTNRNAKSYLTLRSTGPVLRINGLHIHHSRNNPIEGNGIAGVSCDIDNGSELRNLHVHDCVVGDSLIGWSVNTPMFGMTRTSLINANIHDNRQIFRLNTDLSDNSGYHSQTAAFLYMAQGNVRLENVLCENNTVEDLDDYSTSGAWAPERNRGRDILVEAADTLRVRNVIVRNSRQPNWCPEWEGEDLTLGEPSNTIFIWGPYSSIENLLIEDCDDGGMRNWTTFGSLKNVRIRNVSRMGLDLNWGDGLSIARNIWIENVDLADDYLQPASAHLFGQYALGLRNGHYDFSNVTITGCDNLRHPIKLWHGTTSATFRNSVFWNNNSGPLAYLGEGSSVQWEYCSAQEFLPGVGNTVADPRFDSLRGPPFLALDSPCIDAGDPDPAFNDVEDPANPGLPLWPALGTLRNDMGFTGGPYAAVPDTGWVDLPRPYEPKAMPKEFTLGAPWPNPFNPITRIPFTLSRPEIVKLSVHNMLGQEVAVLVHGVRFAGRHEVRWDAGSLASGVYVVQLDVGGKTESRTVTLLR
jgi:hypothetical protein